jgi:hypothetical protein
MKTAQGDYAGGMNAMMAKYPGRQKDQLVMGRPNHCYPLG